MRKRPVFISPFHFSNRVGDNKHYFLIQVGNIWKPVYADWLTTINWVWMKCNISLFVQTVESNTKCKDTFSPIISHNRANWIMRLVPCDMTGRYLWITLLIRTMIMVCCLLRNCMYSIFQSWLKRQIISTKLNNRHNTGFDGVFV